MTESKKCKTGYYYCFTDKKCKKIPMGYHIGARGYLARDNDEDSEEGKKNGNGKNGPSNGNGGTNGGSNGGNGGVSEGTLHKWFKGSKSKDGKGGWVNVVTGGTCASDEPGEGTPKCVSSAKRASMSKAERKSAARRKKEADPGQQQKSGAAKPTYVATDSKRKKVDEEAVSKKQQRFFGMVRAAQKGEMENPSPEVAKVAATAKRSDVKKFASTKHKGLPMKKVEESISEAKDKKGKGSGTKDACYHKVKSRYSVWPSAYASGALVKCRKVGAANWGNKSEEFEMQEKTAHSGSVTFSSRSIPGRATDDSVKSAVSKALANPGKGYSTAAEKGRRENKIGVNYSMSYSSGGDKKKEEKKKKKDKKKPVLKKKDGGHGDPVKPNKPSKPSSSGGGGRNRGGSEGGGVGSRVRSGGSETRPSTSRTGGSTLSRGTRSSSGGGVLMRNSFTDLRDILDEKCWDGYEKKGMKTMFGKRYPNCVKKKKTRKEEFEVSEVEIQEGLPLAGLAAKVLPRVLPSVIGATGRALPFIIAPDAMKTIAVANAVGGVANAVSASQKKEAERIKKEREQEVQLGEFASKPTVERIKRDGGNVPSFGTGGMTAPNNGGLKGGNEHLRKGKKTTKEEAEMVRYCPKCEKNETRDECSYGPKTWDMYSVPANLGPNTFEEKYERIQRLGKTYTVFFTFRGQYKSLQFFFPTSARPSREEVLIQLRKIYPEAVLTNYFERDRVENEPLVQVEGAKSFGKFLMENNPRRTGRPNNPSALERIDAATPGPGAFTYHGFKEKHREPYTYNNPYTGPNYNKSKTTATQRREYAAGGGNAAMKDKNQTADQVRAQGRRNLEARPPNPNVHNWKDGKTKVYAGNPPMRFNVGEGRSVYGSGQLRPYDKIKMGGGKLKSIKDLDAELDKKKGVKEDWQSVNKKDKTDGMSPKAVAAYRRENPGSKLKTAVTGDPKPGSKDAKRRKSFCARSKGQKDMHNIDCSKTPDKPVCKARKRWKC